MADSDDIWEVQELLKLADCFQRDVPRVRVLVVSMLPQIAFESFGHVIQDTGIGFAEVIEGEARPTADFLIEVRHPEDLNPQAVAPPPVRVQREPMPKRLHDRAEALHVLACPERYEPCH